VNVTEIIGSAAGFCTTLAFLPQALRIWRTRSTQDISLGMYLIFCTGVTLWLIYGLLLASLPRIATNAVTLVLAASILIMKLVWRNNGAVLSPSEGLPASVGIRPSL
jgi:MtN3 and saliva related transmembrane protein